MALRKIYVSECYEDSINKIKSYCENQKLWVSIDKTMNAVGRYVTNVLNWTLEVGIPGKIILSFKKVNYTTIAKFLDTSLHFL